MHYMNEICFLIKIFREISRNLFFSMIFLTIFILSKLNIGFLNLVSLVTIFTILYNFLIKLKYVFLSCNNESYSLQCCRRKMKALQKLNKRLYDKIVKEDAEMEQNKFYKSKSYSIYMAIEKNIPVIFLKVCFMRL
jgi:hypothetical protein